jgi:hypothetical protein
MVTVFAYDGPPIKDGRAIGPQRSIDLLMELGLVGR